MSLEPKQKKQGASPIIEARSLLSNGDEGGALAVLREAAGVGNVMACYDCGFLMIQGIGCVINSNNRKEGLKYFAQGRKLKEKEESPCYSERRSTCGECDGML